MNKDPKARTLTTLKLDVHNSTSNFELGIHLRGGEAVSPFRVCG